MSASIKAARASVQGRPSPGVPRGDPGLFGGLRGALKGAFKGLAGGPLGIASGLLGGFREGFGRAKGIQPPPGLLPAIPPPISITTLQQVPQVIEPAPGIRAAVERFLPGGRTGLQVAPSLLGATNGVGPKGFHLNKSAYFLKDGTFIDKGTMFVKNRRRNPLNPRALRAAIGRVDAGKIWQGKLNEITTGKFTSAGNRKSC